MERGLKIISGSESMDLAKKIADEYGTQLGNVSFKKFSDGEFQPNILVSVRGDYVFTIQSTCPPADNLLELLMMIDAARRASAGYITAVIPYFGFARQDRKDKPRVPIGAKLIANLITAAGASRIMTMDLHAPQIQGFFDIPVDHLDSSAIFFPYIESLNLENLVFASPDVGGTKRIMPYVEYFGTDLVICHKHRREEGDIASMTLIGEVEGKDVIMIDDLIDTGGTLSKAAALIKEQGANSVRALCTHPVLSGNAYENIENSALEELVITDTIPQAKSTPKIKVLSVAELFATAIKANYENKSISSLFMKNRPAETT